MIPARRLLPVLLPLLAEWGCFQPPVPSVEKPRARPALGRWEKEGPGRWRHAGEGEGVLLLPFRAPARLEATIRPGRGCALAGILAGYKGPRDTQGILARPGEPPPVGDFPWKGDRRIAPPTAALDLRPGDWKKGFPLAVEIRRDVVRAFRGKALPGFTWRPCVSLDGKLGLYAKGPALFILEKTAVPPGEGPAPDPARIWSRLPPFRPGPVREAAARLLERSLAHIRKLKSLPPREAAPAWLWTGDRIFREDLDAWFQDPPPPGESPRERAERILDWTAFHACLPREGAERARARAQALAVRLARCREEDGLWKGAGRDPLGAWILPGRALLKVLPLSRGPDGNLLFQAWRSAMNRTVEAILPGKDGKRRAATWSTSDLLQAGLFLAESSARRAALSASLETLECLLEEQRLARREGEGLLLLEKDGKECSLRSRLLWARLLSRMGRGKNRAGYGESALRAAASALLGAPAERLPFSSLAALLGDLPRLAPAGSLGIVATRTQVLSIVKSGGVLSWTTPGPSTETLVTGFSSLLLTDGERVLPLKGPLLQAAHQSNIVVLRPGSGENRH